MSPVIPTFEVAEDVTLSESTIPYAVHGQAYGTPPGSESMAYCQSSQANVGDPDSSSRREVSADKCNSQEAEMAIRKSDGP